MEPLDLSKLTPDPLTKAQAESTDDTITVSGYVRSTDKRSISICESQISRSWVEYPRSSVVAAFREDDESERITLLVKSEAEVRAVRRTRASDSAGGNACGCSEIGVSEARPLGSIHPALAQFAADVMAAKNFFGPGSLDLKCASERYDRSIAGEDSEELNELKYRKCNWGIPR